MQQHLDFMELIPLSGIRAALARQDAMLVLSHDLQTIVWANDAGARLLGEENAATAIGANTDLSPQTRRQILALNLQNEIPQTVMLRLGGLQASLQQCTVTPLPLDTAENPVILMTTAASDKADNHALSLPQHHVVQLQADGTVLNDDAQFDALQINSNTLADLIIETQDEAEGIVRRRVRAGQGTLPAMMIRLDDQDVRAPYLFIVPKVQDNHIAPEPAPAAETTEEPAEVHAEPESTSQNKSELATEEAAPARFIWKVDADTVFTEISPEFAAIVGNNAADIIGRKFSDVAKVFGFDSDGVIAALLNQRETWSGKRIFWPLQGTDQRIPVDLAALPAFARDKAFSGFSGFGVLYPSLAETDPEAIGMALISGPVAVQSSRVASLEGDATKNPLASEKIILMEALRASQIRQQDLDTASEQKPADTEPHKTGTITEIRPARPESGLSPTERNAFREIADRLRREVLQKTPKPQSAEHSSVAEAAPVPDAEPVTATTPLPLKAAEIPYPHDTQPANFNQHAEKAGKLSGQPETMSQEDEDLHVLSGLPVPVLIHSADRLHFANQAFFDMTGYTSLDDLRHAGGIDALFAQADDSNLSGMILCLADGGHKIVEAHLQSVPWQGARALMLSLLPELVLKADNDDTISTKPAKLSLVSTVENAPLLHENPVHQMQSELVLQSEENPETEEDKPDTVSTSADSRKPSDFQALQTQIDELTSILDTATDGVVIIGQDGKIRSLNQSAAALFGYDVNELAGKSFAVLFAIESQRAAIDYIHGLSGDGVASLLNDGREVIGREAQGRFIPLFMTIGKLPASKGYCAVMRDITQWKRAEEELTSARQEAERASTHKTEFLARISHEIRTPLNAIIGFSELMAEEKFGPIGNDRYREYLRDIHRSGNHVLALVNDLLDISKIEAGALDLEFEAVALNDALAEAVALMQPQANRERVIIRSSFSAFLPDIVADARSIRQVALNLLSNAIRFTGQGGQVIVSTSYEPDGHVVMRVRDTGIGMNQNELEQALKPFRQVSNHHNQTQTLKNADVKDWRQQGTGLGLPLTKAMVEANRAQFSIESAPEQGTTVEITFPPTRVLAE
ncbi:PAS domain S-box protein [Pseudochrobactrum sp. sp1633]|uniref:ATP-binding protein n=1 Tax=Pseudochrobactrum sp. sp1633 TaxID=3036706 RepID=UPI0025A559AD|nr:ATP-binding protein [Pseudochrobactrum sp. sp1633]MDM8346539.1 PAS domain S-box protein [Pseudochrobactrum sp. sp1633]HWD12756.1 ATP-binding protein [Pseudochrobactrum sp.]